MTAKKTLKKIYISEVNKEMSKFRSLAPQMITEESIASLPDPVRRHFRVCGFLGQSSFHNVRVIWKSTFIKMNKKHQWLKLRCDQFNSTPEPARIVLMCSRIGGVIPFSGRDKFQDGHGNMYIRLMSAFTVGNVLGPKMDQSALVTVLAEIFLIPSYSLQPYIKWEPIDSLRAGASIEYNNVKASGVFSFSKSGEFVQFTTDERWQNETDENPVRWSVKAHEYGGFNGQCFPARVCAVWHEPDGDFEYFRGVIEGLEFGVT